MKTTPAVRLLLSRHFISVLVFFAVILLSGCGGSGGGNAGLPGTPISDAQRMVLLNGLQQAVSISSLTTPTQVLAAADAYYAAHPEFVQHGISTDDLDAYGIFSDGRISIVGANRLPSSGVLSRPQPAPSPRRSITSEHPQQLGARLMNVFTPPLYNPAAPAILPVLQKYGYTIDGGAVGGADVEDWKNLSQDGVVFIDTHGHAFKPARLNGAVTVSLWTTTKVSAAQDAIYKADLDNGSLVYSTQPNGVAVENHYALTELFFNKYVHFAPNALVFLNACSAGRPGVFEQSILDSGAGAVIGWDQPVSDTAAYDGAKFVFDRLFGDNTVAPVTSGDGVVTDLSGLVALANTTTDPTTSKPYGLTDNGLRGCKMAVYINPKATLDALTPIIQSFNAVAGFSVVSLTGVFGSTQGEVHEVDSAGNIGQSLAINSWTPSTVKFTVQPTTQKVVAVVKSRIGNQVSLFGNTYKLMSDTADGSFTFNDDVTIWDNSTVLVDTHNGQPTTVQPLTFTASRTDTLRIQVRTSHTFGGSSNIILVTPSGSKYTISSLGEGIIPDKSGIVWDSSFPLKDF